LGGFRRDLVEFGELRIDVGGFAGQPAFVLRAASGFSPPALACALAPLGDEQGLDKKRRGKVPGAGERGLVVLRGKRVQSLGGPLDSSRQWPRTSGRGWVPFAGHGARIQMATPCRQHNRWIRRRACIPFFGSWPEGVSDALANLGADASGVWVNMAFCVLGARA